jgi:hypothetical protein
VPGRALARLPGVEVLWEHVEVTQSERVKREFSDRSQAEDVVARLQDAGFRADEISLNTRGGRTLADGTFAPGGLVLIVTADALRAREAERIIS